MSWLEGIAAALGVINIFLIIRRSVWNYPFGIAMVTLYAFIFNEARLYSDAILQGFFFVVQIYGWNVWRAASTAAQVPVRWLDPSLRVRWAGGMLLCWLAWSSVMATQTDAAAPWTDGAIAVMSVAAQLLMARRMVDNWVLWIIVDLIAVPLFASRGLYVTAGLYALFLAMAVAGLREWTRAARTGVQEAI